MIKPVNYNTKYVVGTPLVAWKCDRNEHMYWLQYRDSILARFPNTHFFAALELDHRGLDPFTDILTALKEVNGAYWTFTVNDHETTVTSTNRWIRIETARNLIREYAQRLTAEAVLYVDSDITITPDIVEALFEVDHPLVGVNVPDYVLKGPVVNENPHIEEHWTTAGLLLVNSPAYYDLAWHHNANNGLSDDPSFQDVATRLLQRGVGEPYGQTWVRKDIMAKHQGQLIAVENRNIPPRGN